MVQGGGSEKFPLPLMHLLTFRAYSLALPPPVATPLVQSFGAGAKPL